MLVSRMANLPSAPKAFAAVAAAAMAGSGNPVSSSRVLTITEEALISFSTFCRNRVVSWAKSELIAYTLRQPNSPGGWLKLGTAQLRTRELAPAEKSFENVLRLNAHNPEALNALGVIQLRDVTQKASEHVRIANAPYAR